MDITYIYHSCFLVETGDYYYLFDYYLGELPLLKAGKPVIVFASHSHPDHYNRDVFSLLKAQNADCALAVLSTDIFKKAQPEDVECLRVRHGGDYELPGGVLLTVLDSTDRGGAFLLRTPEGNIFHAGDLNDWVWAGEEDSVNKRMTQKFRREIDRLAGTPVETAFIVLDPRQEADYDRGILYFLETVRPAKVFPMHYWDKPEIIRRFLDEHPEYQGIVQETEQ